MKVYELLSDESKWTQGADARDKMGRSVDLNGKEAVSWCARSAIHKCYPSYNDSYEVRMKLKDKIGLYTTIWNDSVTYEEVIGVFKEIDR